MSKLCYSVFRSTVRKWKLYIENGNKPLTYITWRFGDNPTYQTQKNIQKLINEKGYITLKYKL